MCVHTWIIRPPMSTCITPKRSSRVRTKILCLFHWPSPTTCIHIFCFTIWEKQEHTCFGRSGSDDSQRTALLCGKCGIQCLHNREENRNSLFYQLPFPRLQSKNSLFKQKCMKKSDKLTWLTSQVCNDLPIFRSLSQNLFHCFLFNDVSRPQCITCLIVSPFSLVLCLVFPWMLPLASYRDTWVPLKLCLWSNAGVSLAHFISLQTLPRKHTRCKEQMLCQLLYNIDFCCKLPFAVSSSRRFIKGYACVGDLNMSNRRYILSVCFVVGLFDKEGQNEMGYFSRNDTEDWFVQI